MNVFKYFTFGYWYDAWEEGRRNRLRKDIEHVKNLLVEIDVLKTQNLMDEDIMDWCNNATKIFGWYLKDLERDLRNI